MGYLRIFHNTLIHAAKEAHTHMPIPLIKKIDLSAIPFAFKSTNDFSCGNYCSFNRALFLWGDLYDDCDQVTNEYKTRTHTQSRNFRALATKTLHKCGWT